ARTGTTWRQFLARHRRQVLACDFLVVESLRLKTLYALFFIELGTRRVHLAGCTARPTAAWVTQQARNLAWRIQEGAGPCRLHTAPHSFTAAGAVRRANFQAPLAGVDGLGGSKR